MSKRDNKEKKPIDKKKIMQSVIICILIAAMLISVGATLIYAILNA